MLPCSFTKRSGSLHVCCELLQCTYIHPCMHVVLAMACRSPQFRHMLLHALHSILQSMHDQCLGYGVLQACSHAATDVCAFQYTCFGCSSVMGFARYSMLPASACPLSVKACTTSYSRYCNAWVVYAVLGQAV